MLLLLFMFTECVQVLCPLRKLKRTLSYVTFGADIWNVGHLTAVTSHLNLKAE